MNGPIDSRPSGRPDAVATVDSRPGAAVAFRLRIVASHEAWRTGQDVLVEETMTIGRDHACDLVLNDAGVSRQHARLIAVDGGLAIHDLASGNGVWRGTERVTEALLRHGERFQIGSTQFECIEVPRLEIAPAREPPVPDSAVDDEFGFVLRVLHGGLRVREVAVHGASAIVGRTVECDVVVTDPDVSRHHARIDRTPNGFRVVDLGSTYGTWTGSGHRPIRPSPHPSGDRSETQTPSNCETSSCRQTLRAAGQAAARI